jgi:hypothetical protein
VASAIVARRLSAANRTAPVWRFGGSAAATLHCKQDRVAMDSSCNMSRKRLT